MKTLLADVEDPYAALLSYRCTPMANGYSPAELLMSRKLRSKVPIPPSAPLNPVILNVKILHQKEKRMRSIQNKLTLMEDMEQNLFLFFLPVQEFG